MRSYVVAALLVLAGCGPHAPAVDHPPGTATLHIGLGASSSTAREEAGLTELVSNLVNESLVLFGREGRPTPVLASQWSYSPDGLSFRLTLSPGTFHDGSPVTASLVRDILRGRLPRYLGPPFEDIQEIRSDGERDVVFDLKRPSRFVLEAMDITIYKPGQATVGTGPFRVVARGDNAHLVANVGYHGGQPGLNRIELKPYASIRAAWADLLRGNVDMLYEVGEDALASLEPSSRVKVFSYRRHYQFMLIFNTRRPALQNAGLRRRLNAAVDRDLLIKEALGGRATPSVGPIWPEHWAAPADSASFAYAPTKLADSVAPLRLTCVVADPSHERVAIALQRQLQSVGVQLDLHMEGTTESLRRVSDGDFDVVLVETVSAPNLLRPYLFWHSKGPYNYGGFASPEVDAALDSIRHAVDDDAYRNGVAAFQQAIVNDPPALFLAWSERARAVSTAFDVPADPGRDPIGTLRMWRPAGLTPTATGN